MSRSRPTREPRHTCALTRSRPAITCTSRARVEGRCACRYVSYEARHADTLFERRHAAQREGVVDAADPRPIVWSSGQPSLRAGRASSPSSVGGCTGRRSRRTRQIVAAARGRSETDRASNCAQAKWWSLGFVTSVRLRRNGDVCVGEAPLASRIRLVGGTGACLHKVVELHFDGVERTRCRGVPRVRMADDRGRAVRGRSRDLAPRG